MKSHRRDLLEDNAVAFSFSLDTIEAWRRRDVVPTSLKRLWRKKFYGLEREGGDGAQILRMCGRGRRGSNRSLVQARSSAPFLSVRGCGGLRVLAGSIH